MFYGHWEVTVDYKWRLYVPRAVSKEFGEFVLIVKNKDGFVEIEKPARKLKGKELPNLYGVRDDKRILIPKHLRGSDSFSSNRKVVLLGKGNVLEVRPRE